MRGIPHFYRPKHTTDPISETNSWGLLSISCKVSSDITTHVWHISLPSCVGEMCIFVSPNIYHVHLNIVICTSRILRQQKRKCVQIYSKFYKTVTLTSTINKNTAELLNHTYDAWPHNPNQLLAYMVTYYDLCLSQITTSHRSYIYWYRLGNPWNVKLQRPKALVS
jgi:hypothetical protein